MTETEQRQSVIDEAFTWLRTPYKHRWRLKGKGVDCAMLLAEVYHAAGMIPAINPPPYPPDWYLHRSEELFLGWVLKFAVKLEDGAVLLPGDISLYSFGRCVSHGAIITATSPLQIIHAHRDSGVVTLDDGTAAWLQKRLHGFYRLTAWAGPEGSA